MVSLDDNMFFGFDLTEEQKDYVTSILNPNVRLVVVNASAGTGKTSLAVAAAKLLVADNQYKELFYIFAPVEEAQMGFTPGDIFEKERKYHGPLLDALKEINENPMQCLFDPTDLVNMKKNRDKVWVSAASHTFLRGTNISQKVVIIDEAQNFTTNELRKILTRIHDDSKVILIGHTGQCDIKQENSGFATYIQHAQNYPYVRIHQLTRSFRGTLAEWADKINEIKQERS